MSAFWTAGAILVVVLLVLFFAAMYKTDERARRQKEAEERYMAPTPDMVAQPFIRDGPNGGGQ